MSTPLACSGEKTTEAYIPRGVWAATPFADNRGPDQHLIDHVKRGRQQGPVPAASFDEAAVMIIVDGLFDGWCLSHLTADVLEKAGYSVWTMWSPCLEGQYLLLHARTSGSELRLVGRFDLESDELSVVVPRRTTDEESDEHARVPVPSREEAELLVVELLNAPFFRRLVGNVAAADSANRFIIGPIGSDEIERLCDRR